jgi:DNA-binding winged helix-turn-helix (wHTH) protein
MERPAANSNKVRFGLFEADLETRELRKSGAKIKLNEQPFQVLALLLKHPGEVVTREELQTRLWPADTFVDFDVSLNGAVKRLRQALGDESDNPRFIETLYRRGYRFIAPVSIPSSEGAPRAVTANRAPTLSSPALGNDSRERNGAASRSTESARKVGRPTATWAYSAAGCLAVLLVGPYLRKDSKIVTPNSRLHTDHERWQGSPTVRSGNRRPEALLSSGGPGPHRLGPGFGERGR